MDLHAALQPALSWLGLEPVLIATFSLFCYDFLPLSDLVTAPVKLSSM